MTRVWLLLAIVSISTACSGTPRAAAAGPAPLRVCADPNNLPFSNRDEQGFENKLAQIWARELGVEGL